MKSDHARFLETRASWLTRLARWPLAILLLALASEAHARGVKEVRVHDSEELIRAARAATPGTTILLEPGAYRGGLAFSGLRGEEGRPIVFAAADPQRRPVIEGGGTCLQLSDPQFVELRDLEFRKAMTNGLNIDDGGSYESPARHVVLHGLVVKDVGSGGNHDGIKLSGLDDFVVEDCEVTRWGKNGSGIDMVGCHRGVIRNCTFREGDRDGGNAVQMKGGSSQVTVRRCRFENAGARAINIGGSTGLPYFRPKASGHEAKDITVEDCTFLGSDAPIAFVGVDGATVQHNTFYRPTRWAARILQETQGPDFVPCRNGRFVRNIVAFRSDELAAAVNVGPKTAPETFTFEGNVWHCIDRPESTRRAIQLPTVETKGVYGQDPRFLDPEKGNLRLAPDSPASAAGPRRSGD